MVPEAQPFRWGVIGPGNIAHRFADALAFVPGARVQRVYGRNVQRASEFAQRYQATCSATSDELLADANVDAVYIATPHAQHGELVRAALLAGKPVLCEKPLVPTLAEAEALVQLARERGVFLMEALWTRFLPAYERAGAWLRDGVIGELRSLNSNFCFSVPFDPATRLWNPALAGGALLDIGIYNLAVTRWALQQTHGGLCPELTGLEVSASIAPTGVDAAVQATLHFAGSVTAQFRCGFDAVSANAFELQGSQGCLRFPYNFWQAESVELIKGSQPPELTTAPFVGNGFEGEIAEAQACIRAGLFESQRMPHAESLALVTWMDAIRRQIGVRYPFESQN
jgi:predicted dehydrogenase